MKKGHISTYVLVGLIIITKGFGRALIDCVCCHDLWNKFGTRVQLFSLRMMGFLFVWHWTMIWSDDALSSLTAFSCCIHTRWIIGCWFYNENMELIDFWLWAYTEWGMVWILSTIPHSNYQNLTKLSMKCEAIYVIWLGVSCFLAHVASSGAATCIGIFILENYIEQQSGLILIVKFLFYLFHDAVCQIQRNQRMESGWI